MAETHSCSGGGLLGGLRGGFGLRAQSQSIQVGAFEARGLVADGLVGERRREGHVHLTLLREESHIRVYNLEYYQ